MKKSENGLPEWAKGYGYLTTKDIDTSKTRKDKQTNSHNDYYNRKNDERFLHFRTSMIGIAILLVIAALLSIGYLNYKVMKGDWKFDSKPVTK